MLFKVLLCFCLLQMVRSGSWQKIATYQCISARNTHYTEFAYNGPSTHITSMKMVHRGGRIGCRSGSYTRWGCDTPRSHGDINIIVTGHGNNRIYPTIVLKSGWYNIPGYYYNSPQIVLSGLRYLYSGMYIRIWYGEDLYNWTEEDNHGHTCMDVYIYKI